MEFVFDAGIAECLVRGAAGYNVNCHVTKLATILWRGKEVGFSLISAPNAQIEMEIMSLFPTFHEF